MDSVGITTRFDRKVLYVPCDCGAVEDFAKLEFQLEPFDDYPMMDMSIQSPRDTSWKERFKMIWHILRGHSTWFSSIILDRPSMEQISVFVQEWLTWARDWEQKQKAAVPSRGELIEQKGYRA